jgi:predicted polyphosphate/ATP-dependent NAD kinase
MLGGTCDRSTTPRDQVSVGVVANPASGRDIRRLVSGASVFDNAEKGSMVFRLLTGLGAAGVERVLMMPTGDGIAARLLRSLEGSVGPIADRPVPELEFLKLPVTGFAEDTEAAVREMVKRDVAAIVVLGGDGTHRLVAKECGDIPICALSTGTNNAFPRWCEPTVAGLATGLFATDRADGRSLRREKMLRVRSAGESHLALVDAATTRRTFVGSRALWRAEDVAEFVVTFADPGAVGLAGVAGLLEPVSRSEPYGLRVHLAEPGSARVVVHAPLAPGLVTPIGIARHERIELTQRIHVDSESGSIALDGERELRSAREVEIELAPGPLTIDVDAVMATAARDGHLRSRVPRHRRSHEYA